MPFLPINIISFLAQLVGVIPRFQVAGAVDVPVIGCGGIMTGTDAIEFLLAGATAVQVGTATFRNPNAPIEMLDGVERYLRDEGVSDVREIIGAARS